MSRAPSNNILELTQTPDTQQAYHRRCQQLAKSALREIARLTGQPIEAVELTPTLFVDYVIGKKGRYRANSWRVVRRSVIFTLARAALRGDQAFADEIPKATARLRAEKPNPDPNKKAETSRTKAKSVADDDWARIEHAALAKRAPSAIDLVCYLKAAITTGLRPCEWPRARLHQSSREGFSWMLIVDNAKATNGRAHGPSRKLYWKGLDLDAVNNINAWIKIAQEDGYQRRLGTIRRQLWEIARELWPRRAKWPTLYSARHAAVAAWKAHYLRDGQSDAERLESLAIIAALAGHGSDETASHHYARPSAASRKATALAVPAADPAEVQKVRRVIDLTWRETAARSLGKALLNDPKL